MVMVTIYSVVIRARDIVANKINRLAGASWAVAAVAAGSAPRDLNGNSHNFRPTAITDSVSGTAGHLRLTKPNSGRTIT